MSTASSQQQNGYSQQLLEWIQSTSQQQNQLLQKDSTPFSIVTSWFQQEWNNFLKESTTITAPSITTIYSVQSHNMAQHYLNKKNSNPAGEERLICYFPKTLTIEDCEEERITFPEDNSGMILVGNGISDALQEIPFNIQTTEYFVLICLASFAPSTALKEAYSLKPYFLVTFKESFLSFLGKYKVIKEIGSGGQGKVYQCIDTTTNEKVAVKIYVPKDFDREQLHLQNVQKLSSEENCNVAPYIETGTYRDISIVVMKFFTKTLLKELGDRQSKSLFLTNDEVIGLFRQILNGLGYIHKNGLIHKDMKLENVMLDSNGVVKIVDYNSLKQERVPLGKHSLVTPLYIAPELSIKDIEPTVQVDIFSIGVMLFELISLWSVHDIANNGGILNLKSNQRGIHAEMVQYMDRNKNNISPLLKRLVLSIVRYDPKVRPSIADILKIFDIIQQKDSINVIWINQILIPLVKAKLTSEEISGLVSSQQMLLHKYTIQQSLQTLPTRNMNYCIHSESQNDIIVLEYNSKIDKANPMEFLKKKFLSETITSLFSVSEFDKYIVPYLSVESNGQSTVVTLPFFSNTLLQEVQERKRTNQYWIEVELIPLFLQICSALAFVHKKGVSHNSLRLENIVLENKTTIKLIVDLESYKQDTNIQEDIKALKVIMYQMIDLMDTTVDSASHMAVYSVSTNQLKYTLYCCFSFCNSNTLVSILQYTLNEILKNGYTNILFRVGEIEEQKSLSSIVPQFNNDKHFIVVQLCSNLQETQTIINLKRHNVIIDCQYYILTLETLQLFANNVIITGLQLQGSLVVRNSKYVKINNSKLFNSKQSGIRCSNSSNIELNHVDCFHNTIDGIRIEDCQDCSINQVTCCNNKGSGIVCIDSTNIQINQSHCNNNNRVGMYFDKSLATVIHSECNQNLEFDGISMRDESKVIIQHCQCNNNNRSGIICDSKCEVTIEDCHCNQNNSRGINIQNDCKAIIRRCICNNNTQNGIFCCTKCNVRIETCECNHSKQYDGIKFQKECIGSVIQCKCHYNNEDGIYCAITKNSVTIEESDCQFNKQNGISFGKESIGSINGGKCLFNGKDQIYCVTPSNVSISNCDITNSSQQQKQ